MQPLTYWQNSVSRESARLFSRGLTKDGKSVFLRSDIYIPDGILQAFIRLNKYSQNEFSQICQHHAFAFSLLTLPPPILSKILSYAKLYFHLLRLTCKFFLHLKPFVSPLRFMDVLLINKHLEAAKFVREKYRLPINGWSHHAAALGGSIEVLKWLQEINCPCSDDVCTSAAMAGHLEAIKWALLQKYECDYMLVTEEAARGGHINILRWLHKHKKLTSIATKGAVIGEKLNVLIWLKKKKIPFHESVCVWSVWRQKIEILQWLVENGAYKDEEACYAAAKCPSIKILKWLIDNDFPYKTSKLLLSAENDNNMKNVQWIRDNLS